MATGTATLHGRDPFMPRRPPGMRSGLALALLAHALLIAGLAYSVDWHSNPPEAVEAELWSALPQQAAPRPVAPPPAPAPAPAPPPPPVPKAQPVQPPPPPPVDPQIAIEKAREAKRVQQQEALAEQEQARREKAQRELAKQEQDRKAAEQQQARDEAQRKKQLADKAKADQAKADQAEAAQREKDRLAQIKRMQSLAGATGDANATGTAQRSSGPSASYAGRIVARIKPNIVFPDAVDGNPVASVEVRVAPDGSIVGRRLVQSSGVKAWDDAVLRAIDRTDGLPRDIDGRVPPVMTINFRPRDL